MSSGRPPIQEEDTAGAIQPPVLGGVGVQEKEEEAPQQPTTGPRLQPRRANPPSPQAPPPPPPPPALVQEEAIPGALPPPDLGTVAEEDMAEEEVFATPAGGGGGEAPSQPQQPPRRSGRHVPPASLPPTQQPAQPTPGEAEAAVALAPAPAPRKASPPAGPAKKAGAIKAKKAAGRRGGAPRRDRTDDYRRAIHAVVAQVGHSGAASISAAALTTLNDLLVDVRDRLAGQAASLVRASTARSPRQTLSARDVQAAVRLAFPGELAKHAVHEGTKAVVRSGVPRGGV